MIAFLRSLIQSPLGFGSAGIRRQAVCGAVTILGFTGQYGVELAESGISIRQLVIRYFGEINAKIMDNVGETRGRVKSQKFSREATIEGEVLSSLGVMAYTLTTACAINNDASDFGDGSGTFLLDEATVTQQRADWRSVSIKISSDPGLTL